MAFLYYTYTSNASFSLELNKLLGKYDMGLVLLQHLSKDKGFACNYYVISLGSGLLSWAELGSSVSRCCKHLGQRAKYIGSPSQQSLNWCNCLLARQCVQVCWRPCINGAHLAKPMIAFRRLFYLTLCGLLQISNCYSSLFSAHTKTTKQGLCHCVRHLRTLW